jgi:hypothetical protein
MKKLALLRKTTALAGLGLLLLGADARADLSNPFEMVESTPLSQTWLNFGFYSDHFDRDKGLNNSNPGLGIEYRYSTVASFTGGRFYNSDREYSNYVGWYYQPVALGPFRLGAVVGAFNGYPKMLNGGWFPALIPVISYEYKRVGLNLGIVPSYKDRLYGAFAFQLKVKLFD